MKYMVTHGKQSNDAIIQITFKKTDVDDESSIDKNTIMIRNTLIRDMSFEIYSNIELLRVMMKSLMHNLNRSKPVKFCKDIYNFLL